LLKSMIVRRWLSLRLLLSAALLLSPAAAFAAEPKSTPTEPNAADDAIRVEAAQRFERGIQLFNAGDNAGALSEFKRIYEIRPNPVVLYNIGLVYAAMARPVDAVDTLQAAITAGGLPPKDLERAEATLADQKARVGRVFVTTNPAGARVEVDNVEVATTPLTAPIRVSQGNHIIGAVAEGFAVSRKEVVVAGNADARLHLELVPTRAKQRANLSVRTRTPAAQVFVDGRAVGQTPLSSSVTVPAGKHVVELRRPGYVSLRREIDVGEGATGELVLDLSIDPASLGAEGATLVLEPTESPVELVVDGERKGVYSGPVRLPRGAHRIGVAAAGFIPVDLQVTLDGTFVVPVVLEPTPETRERYESAASFHRTWGLVGIIGGAVLGGAGASLSIVAASQQNDGEAALDEVDRKLDQSEAPCDFRSGFESSGGTPAQCDEARNDAQNEIDSAKALGIAGYVGIGVGAAVAVTGLVVLLTGDDPNKYERTPARAVHGARAPRFSFVPGPGDLGSGVRVTF
jgi:hypothetical protein